MLVKWPNLSDLNTLLTSCFFKKNLSLLQHLTTGKFMIVISQVNQYNDYKQSGYLVEFQSVKSITGIGIVEFEAPALVCEFGFKRIICKKKSLGKIIK